MTQFQCLASTSHIYKAFDSGYIKKEILPFAIFSFLLFLLDITHSMPNKQVFESCILLRLTNLIQLLYITLFHFLSIIMQLILTLTYWLICILTALYKQMFRWETTKDSLKKLKNFYCKFFRIFHRPTTAPYPPGALFSVSMC